MGLVDWRNLFAFSLIMKSKDITKVKLNNKKANCETYAENCKGYKNRLPHFMRQPIFCCRFSTVETPEYLQSNYCNNITFAVCNLFPLLIIFSRYVPLCEGIAIL